MKRQRQQATIHRNHNLYNIRVLSKAKNLPRKGEGEINGIFMHQDLTPKQRVRRQELVKELKSRQSQGEKNLIIVNWKIVERRNVKKDEV